MSARRVARVLLIAGILIGVWAIVIAITGGFRVEAGPVRISSRNSSRTFLLALLALTAAWRLGYQVQVATWIERHAGRLHQLAPAVAWTCAGLFLLVGILCGSRAAAASDPFGYVSQSALWARRTVRLDYSFAAQLPWPEASQTLAPLGYKVAPDSVMVPTYAPGVPLLMALTRMASACGPFVVGPLCGAALILSTFYLGRRTIGSAAATAATILVACSPVVLYMSLMPMADIPAAAFWTGALATSVGGQARHSFAAGVLTGIGILVRPNLAPLAVFPWLMIVTRAPAPRPAMTRTLLFTTASVPCALFVGWVNAHLYGSPLTSGYGGLGDVFSVSHAWTNARRYVCWWWESQSPLGFVFLLALWKRGVSVRDALILSGFSAAVLLLYLFYLPFDVWWFLRFLLPAVPIVFLFSADAVLSLARSSSPARSVALVAFVAIAAAHAARFNDLHDITSQRSDQERYVQPAVFMNAVLPADSIVLTVHHSGSIRYYAGRLTLRWDLLDPAWLDRVVEELQRRQIPVYALMEHFEVRQFEERFSGQHALAFLRSTPLAIGRSGEQRLYSLDSRFTGTPAIIPDGGDRHCRDLSPGFFRPPAVERLR